jgi:hypothetical protein
MTRACLHPVRTLLGSPVVAGDFGRVRGAYPWAHTPEEVVDGSQGRCNGRCD